MRKKLFRALTGLSPVLFLVLVLAACSNPSGGDGGGEEEKTTLTVSGTVTPADLAALGLKPDEAAVLEFYSPQGEKIAEAQIAGGGSWSAEIAPAYKDSEIRVTLLVPTEDGDRIFECGKITMDAGGGPVIEVLIPGTADEYTIGTSDPVNGVFTVAREKALKGELIRVSAVPAAGYKVRAVTVAGDSGGLHAPTAQAGINSWTFTMPAANVTVQVEFIPEAVVVDAFSLDGLVTAPVRDTQPVTTGIDTVQHTGTVAWQTGNGTTHSGPFAASTVYKALVTLTAKTGYTFDGVAENSFTYTGATSVSNAAGSGTVTITFPATAAPGQSTAVNAFSLNGRVTAPVKDAQPVTTGIDTVQYTGTIAWQTGNGTPHSGLFAASTVYKALVTLTAKPGYTFNGVGANRFTYTGATSVTNAANSGTVTITFPATGSDEAPPAAVTVSALTLNTLVTAPVRDTQPDTRAINATQYTGTIAWQTGNGPAHTGAFAPATVYKAVVTLTAKPGYTFNGVRVNRFTYTGATSVTNAANSGTVTITFPATSNADIPIGNPSLKLYLDGGTTPLAHNESTTITGTGIFTVSIDAGSYDEIIWRLNGNEITTAQGKTSIALSKRTPRNYLVTVEATPGGGIKQSGAHTFVVE
jgi:hypothetical protein